MGIWERLDHFVTALWEDSADLEARVGQLIRDLEREVESLQYHAARTIAAERRLAREIRRQEARIEVWCRKAMHDPSALLVQREQEEVLEELQSRYEAADQARIRARAEMDKGEVQLLEARIMQEVLRG